MFWKISSRKIYLIQIYKHTNCFYISDLHGVENNPLVGMLAILTNNKSVFQPYQFAETVICWI